jgi:hypothetical protein
MRPGVPRWALVAVDAFVALAAIGGGLALALGMEAGRFPLSWLEGSPFSDYVGPGLILAVVVGGSAAVATVTAVRDARQGGRVSIVAGAILVAWVVGEVVILIGDGEVVSPTEAVFLAVGLVMVALGAVVGRRAEARRGPGSPGRPPP